MGVWAIDLIGPEMCMVKWERLGSLAHLFFAYLVTIYISVTALDSPKTSHIRRRKLSPLKPHGLLRISDISGDWNERLND